MSGRFPRWFLPVLATAFALGLGEVGLRIAEKKTGYKPELLTQKTTESFTYYHAVRENRTPPPPQYFDPLLGWRSILTRGESSARCTKNRQGWRSVYDYEQKKSRPRVIVVGDSFINYCLHDDAELITHYLQGFFGDGVEVMNMGVPGFGIDQMALVSTRIARDFEPDAVVFAFIKTDLERSCHDYFYGTRKPYFILKNGKAEPAGIPVPTTAELMRAHHSRSARLKDALVTWATNLRVVRLVSQVYLKRRLDACIAELNPLILDHAIGAGNGKTDFFIAYLDGGALPADFLRRVSALPAKYLDLSDANERYSQRLGVKGGKISDGHFDPAMNKLVAYGLFEALRPTLSK
jgi:hypothetical protein